MTENVVRRVNKLPEIRACRAESLSSLLGPQWGAALPVWSWSRSWSSSSSSNALWTMLQKQLLNSQSFRNKFFFLCLFVCFKRPLFQASKKRPLSPSLVSNCFVLHQFHWSPYCWQHYTCTTILVQLYNSWPLHTITGLQRSASTLLTLLDP